MKRKLTPRRGATIERAAVLRKIRALEKKYLEDINHNNYPMAQEALVLRVVQFSMDLKHFVATRVDRFTKRKGGL